MTEDRIKELQSLLHRREVISNEIEKLTEIVGMKHDELYYHLHGQGSSEYSCIHIMRDHHGHFMDAVRKILQEYKDELEKVRKEIDEF